MKPKPLFLTDLGQETTLVDRDTGHKVEIHRYGVWGDKGNGKAEVLETSNDLGALRKEFGMELRFLPDPEGDTDD